ncbi:GNAT family N-acetyltransferase [Clostridiaceae bacterium M8S5]|nr:GNAT family N-acetyltransferase [Clostridiaceae bacterium M8S5]
MVINRFRDVSKFNDVVKDYLLRNEAFNILSLGIISKCMQEEVNPKHIFIAIQDDNEEIVFVMIQTINKMVLTGDIDYIDEAIEYLENNYIKLEAIIGRVELIDEFANRYSKRYKLEQKTDMNQRIYRLDKTNEVKKQNGILRLADNKDINELVPWVKDFVKYAGSEISLDKARENAIELIDTKRLHVWENDGKVISMVARAKKSDNGIVINWVYTPPEYRCKGYATTCVAEFSSKLLEKNEFVALYTDLANPISNSIYMKIGYNPVGDSKVISFK